MCAQRLRALVVKKAAHWRSTNSEAPKKAKVRGNAGDLGSKEAQGMKVKRNYSLTSMDADPNMYPILIPPASNIFHFCHHPQPHHSQPYHAQSIIYHPSFIINGNSQYWAYSITTISIFPIFSRLPSPICPTLNSVKQSSPQNNSCHRRYSPVQNISSTMHIFRNEVNSPSWW